MLQASFCAVDLCNSEDRTQQGLLIILSKPGHDLWKETLLLSF